MAFDAAVLAGQTSKVVEVVLRDSSTGMGKTGLAYGSVSASYCREGGTRQAITLASGSAGDAYSSGKWAEVDATNMPGVYQLHIPDAALASGAAAVTIALKATGVIDKAIRISLLAVNVQDATAFGLSRLDAPVASRLATTDYTAPANADVTAIKAKTDNLPASPAATGAAMTLTSAYDAAKTALSAAAYTTPPTVSDIATAVWGAGTRTLSSFGTLVSDVTTAVWGAGTRTLTAFGTVAADAAAAVWAVAKASLTATGTIGRWLGTEMAATIGDAQTQADMSHVLDRLDTTLEANGDSSRFTTAALANGPTGSAPTAAQIDSQLSGTHGAGTWGATQTAGRIAVVIGVHDGSGNGMPGVAVVARADDDPSAPIIDQGITADDGTLTLYLQALTTYYIWRSKPGYSWSPNPTSITTEAA